MNIKSALLKNTLFKKMYSLMGDYYYCFLTAISPSLNTKARYKKTFNKDLNLENPTTFTEKLLWLKLNNYIQNPLVFKCVDKYRVREYVEDCGFSEILNELIGVWDRASDIPWDTLPDKFVLKWNFGAGMNIVCTDKSKLNPAQTIKQLETWGKRKYWLLNSEMQYKYVPKKIVCEKFLEDKKYDVIPDYKVYCFNGEPKAIFVMMDRGSTVKTGFFDSQWNALENTAKYESIKDNIEKPAVLDQMLDVCRHISKPFPFVRCDFYIVDNKLYFGELTFTPAGGMYTSQTTVDGKTMGELLDLT